MKKSQKTKDVDNLVKLFFCYNFQDTDVVSMIYFNFEKYIKKDSSKRLEIYFYDDAIHKKQWKKETEKIISECDYFLIFCGKKLGQSQILEMNYFIGNAKKTAKAVRINLYDNEEIRASGKDILYNSIFTSDSKTNKEWVNTKDKLKKKLLGPIEIESKNARSIYDNTKKLAINFIGFNYNEYGIDDDLPNFNTFSYEKDIIRHFISKKKIEIKIEKEVDLSDAETKEYTSINENIKKGCPVFWPKIEELNPEKRIRNNPLEQSIVGNYRKDKARIFSAALTTYHEEDCFKTGFDLTFPEAGPREMLLFPRYLESKYEKGAFRVAVLVSGGIAPGINAVIDGITQRHFMYHEKQLIDKPSDRNLKDIEIWGLKNGFQAFNDFANNIIYLINNEETIPPKNRPFLVTSKHVNEAGSILGTSREETLLIESERKKYLDGIIKNLKGHHIRILYIIGGDGSMRASHAIYNLAKASFDEKWDLAVIGIPKTMDNDILWAWQTFGFSSAVEKSRMVIEDLAVEVSSNPRLGIIQLFGSDSGYVVSHSVLASSTGVCDLALIPEVDFSINKISQVIKTKYSKKGYGLVVLAETAIPTDALQFIDFRPAYIVSDFYDKLGNDIKQELDKYYTKANFYFFSDFSSEENLNEFLKLINDTPCRNKLFQHYISEDIYNELGKLKNLALLIKNLNPREVYRLRDDLKSNEEEALRDYLKTLNAKFGFCNLYALLKKNKSVEEICTEFPYNYKLEKGFRLHADVYFFKGSTLDFLKLIDQFNKRGIYHYIDVDLSSQEKLAVIQYYKAFIDNRRIEGQTNDSLRSAGLKMVTKGIKLIDPKWGEKIRTLTSEPRHLLRSMPPGTIDIINGSRLGTLAVDNAMAGYTDFMISQWLTEFCMVPLKLVILGRKRIPKEGIFWKSVIAKTGQPENLI